MSTTYLISCMAPTPEISNTSMAHMRIINAPLSDRAGPLMSIIPPPRLKRISLDRAHLSASVLSCRLAASGSLTTLAINEFIRADLDSSTFDIRSFGGDLTNFASELKIESNF